MTERFELIAQVGRGAMGVVWKARDNERGKFVAIKMLRDLHLDDAEYIERFAREVDLARSVKSPHIVRVRGYGARDGVPFVVLEFVEGRSLRAYIAERGPFPPAEARDLLAQIADALVAVHAAGIIHRDVKASNVLLTEDGVAKLTDFGIARGGDAKGATRKGSLLGTPAYMAPEGPIDARSDLYSLGVVYFELLAGVLPFTSSNYHEVIRAHVEEKPDLTRLPASERGLTGWLLSKDPAQRPKSAEVLLAALRSHGGPSRPPIPAPAQAQAVTPAAPAARPIQPAPNPGGGSWTQSAASVPVPIPAPPQGPARTPTPIPSTSPRPYDSTRPPAPRSRSKSGDRRAALIAVVLGIVAFLTVVGVVLLAAGASWPAASAGPSAVTSVTHQGTSNQATIPLIAVAVLALGALAVAATLATSRARKRGATARDSGGSSHRGSAPTN